MPIKDFGAIFGLSVEHDRSPGEGHLNSSVWGKLTGDFNPSSMQHLHASSVQHPVPFVWFRFMAFTIFGRDQKENVRSTELEVLGGFLLDGNEGYRMNLAHHLAMHLLTTANHRYLTDIALGGLVTHIAIAVANFAERDHAAVRGNNLLDLEYFGSLYRVHSEYGELLPGQMSWMFQRNALFTLPDTTGLTSFTRGQSHYIYVGEQAPPLAQPQPQPQPEAAPRTYFRRGVA